MTANVDVGWGGRGGGRGTCPTDEATNATHEETGIHVIAKPFDDKARDHCQQKLGQHHKNVEDSCMHKEKGGKG